MSSPVSDIQFLIITPSYNQAKYIPQTINSILTQDFLETTDKPLIYWVIDGNSNDDTKDILKSYKKKIKWVSEKDKGQTDAINKGIKNLEKERDIDPKKAVFAYINSDDYYLPGAFQKVAEIFSKNSSVNWVVGDCEIVDESGKQIHQAIGIYKKIIRRIFQPWMLGILNPIPQPAVFIRWSAVEKNGKFNQVLRYVMDYEYWLRLQKKLGAPFFIKDTVAAFRVHSTSKGGTQFVKQFNEQYQVARLFVKNPLLLGFHLFHNTLTKLIYRIIK
jgi:glycosyltransferase involved in cell wall biosynthesis